MRSHPPDSILITVYDLKRLFLRLLPTLKTIAIYTFCIASLLLLCREPKYLAKATFKHLNKQSDFSPFAKEIFKEFSSLSKDWPTFSVMHSNEVLKNTIETLGMQIAPASSFNPFRFFKRALENLECELGSKPDDKDGFCFRNVSYSQEKPLQFYIRPINSANYEVLDKDKKVIALGQLKEPIAIPHCAFTLLSFPHQVKEKAVYRFKVAPWIATVESVRKTFEIKEHKLDSNVFYLSFAHSDRMLASQFLNQAMKCYQEYYQKENEEIYETQVAYLEKRQNELVSQYDAALKDHTVYLKKNIDETGCMGFSKELEAFEEPQNAFNAKLFDVDLELKRLHSLDLSPALIFANAKKKDKIQTASLKQDLERSSLELDLETKRMDIAYPKNIHQSDLLNCDALTLQSAKTFYQQNVEKRDQIEARLREHIFLQDRINDADFELSSLSTFLSDPVSLSLAQNASAISLKIGDGENRTAREQERLKEELEMQKRFLHQHLTHMIDLEKSQLMLLSHKIEDLQLQMKNLLDEEKLLLQGKLTELKEKMASLPEKWHRENLLFLKKELGSRMIGSMTQLVESKNLNQKLYQVASKHLDLSVPPLRPLRPLLLLYSLLAAFAGCSLFYLYKFCALLIKGFPVSHANLHYSGFHSLGTLSTYCDSALKELNDSDMQTLRGLAHFLSSLPKNSCAALLMGKNPDCSSSLAELLFHSGQRVLLIHTIFDAVVKKEDVPGLWHYLQGQEKEIPIRHRLHFDELPSGGTSRFGLEMLSHPKFISMLSELKQRYDIVLLHSNIPPARKEMHIFAKIADALIAATCDESLEDLSHYRDWTTGKAGFFVSFVCFE